MLNVKLIALFSAGLFLLVAPVFYHQVWGKDDVNLDAGKVAPVPQTDESITKNIKDQLSSDKEFAADAANVEIKTEKGKVTLSGTVKDKDTKEDIETVAKENAGDNNVTNNIVVEPEK